MPEKAPTVLRFLDPVTQPSAGSSAKVRKQVRSHVTAQQHRSKRWHDHQASEASRAKSLEAAALRLQNEHPDDEKEEEPADELLPIVSHSADLSNPLAAAFSQGSLAFQLYILHDPDNNVGRILNGLGTDAMTVIQNYANLVRLQTPEWERQYSTITKPGIAYRYLIPGLFQDPALIASCMLLSLSQLIASRKQPIEPRIIYGILQLRGHVMRAINEALNDPKRATSEHLIISVLLLATCEALHGLRESYPVHMVGLMDMVNCRGGLRELGFEGCVEAFILWQDANIANIVGGKRYSHLAKNPSALPEAKADKEHFLAGAVVNADTFADENTGKDVPRW